MAERIVILGWGGQAIELESALDADALVSSGMMRVSLTLWAGPLANATVLRLTPGYLRAHGGENEDGYAKAMSAVRQLVRPEARREFILETPIPVKRGRSSS